MKDRAIRLLLQGGTGNQLMQMVIARFAAQALDKRLIIYQTLLGSFTRKLRGITLRESSRMILELATINKTPLHRWIHARMARRMGIFNGLIISDKDLLARDIEATISIKSDAMLIITHGTTPKAFKATFKEFWRDIYSALPKVQPRNCIGLHLRRGDYLNPASGFMTLPLDYYRRAIQRSFEQMPQLERRIVLFSDDPDWGQAHLSDSSWVLEIASGTPEEDLAAMAAMPALVISNSSLSAIAAHLGESFGEMQLVICPDQWLSAPNRKALGDLRKPSWISLPIQP